MGVTLLFVEETRRVNITLHNKLQLYANNNAELAVKVLPFHEVAVSKPEMI